MVHCVISIIYAIQVNPYCKERCMLLYLTAAWPIRSRVIPNIRNQPDGLYDRFDHDPTEIITS